MILPRPPKPAKPYPDFPLTAHPAGYWCKKIRGRLYYFGPWADPNSARHRGIQNWHPEPRQAMDRDGCIAELRELQHFFRAALSTSTAAELPPNTIVLLGERCYRIGDNRPVVLGEPMNDVLQSFLAQPAMDHASW